jgi:hypothetical protein
MLQDAATRIEADGIRARSTTELFRPIIAIGKPGIPLIFLDTLFRAHVVHEPASQDA